MGQVREWLDALLEDGPKYGYYPEPRKSIAIVKDWRQLERAKQEFQGLGLEFVEASRFLGGFLGKEEVVRQLLEEKVTKWVEAVEDLSEAAVVYPRDAYVCFLKSLQCEWGYTSRGWWWKGLLLSWSLWTGLFKTSSYLQCLGVSCRAGRRSLSRWRRRRVA